MFLVFMLQLAIFISQSCVLFIYSSNLCPFKLFWSVDMGESHGDMVYDCISVD